MAVAADVAVGVLPAAAAAAAGENWLGLFVCSQGQAALGGAGALKILRDDFVAVYGAQRGVDPLHLTEKQGAESWAAVLNWGLVPSWKMTRFHPGVS